MPKQRHRLAPKLVRLNHFHHPPQIEALPAEPEIVTSDAAHNDNAEPAGTPEREQHQTSSPPESIKDFLLDYLYPLGAKK